MNIYHYHPDTREFLGQGEARPDPLTPGEFLIPAHATEIDPPPIGSHEKQVFIGGNWKIVADYRGTKVYLKTDPAEEKTVDVLGDIPSDYTDMVPDPYSKWNGLKWAYDAEKEKAAMKLAKQAELANTDTYMPRITEDILDALKSKGIIANADIPKSVWDKIADRKRIRQELAAIAVSERGVN